MRKKYSRLANIEERKSIKTVIVYLSLIIAAIIGIFFLGIPGLVKIAGLLTNIRKIDQPIDKNDLIPPPPPYIESLPEATNNRKITIKGKTEAGATIILSLNDETKELITDSGGEFAFDYHLLDGENKFFAKARDSSGNEGQPSKTQTATFDDQPPSLEISSPQDGQTFFGSKQRQVSIVGTTEQSANLTINERPIALENSGGFLFVTTLNEGDNLFKVVSLDKAGNRIEKTITLKYSP